MKLCRSLLAAMLSLLTLGLTGCRDTAVPTTLTVMSWNILNPSWGGLSVDQRCDALFDTLGKVLPDVIGVQEASKPWHEAFTALPSNYVPVCAVSNSGKDNMTMFLYNTDTLTLIESGVEDLDTNSDIRVVSWAVFEAQNSKQEFLVTNTHPDSREAQCLIHTEQYLDIVGRLYEEKGLPMLSVGDFNAIEDSAAYKLSIADGFTDCKYAEGVEQINDIDSYLLGDYGGKVTVGQGSRDHVFFKGAVTPLSFETLYGDTVQVVSDHLPVVAKMTVG